MNAIEQMVQQQVATNHTAVGAKVLPNTFAKAMAEALTKTVAKAKAEEAAEGKWLALSKLLYGEGWTVASIDQSLVGKANRDLIRAGMVDNWPNEAERAHLKADPKTLTDEQKKRVKTIRQGFGPNLTNIEKYLTRLETEAAEAKAKAELEAAIAAGQVEVVSEEEAKAAEEAKAKAEKEAKRLKQCRKALEDAIRHFGEMTGLADAAGQPVDLVKAKADVQAILGRLPV
jgi:hypothetical protein